MIPSRGVSFECGFPGAWLFTLWPRVLPGHYFSYDTPANNRRETGGCGHFMENSTFATIIIFCFDLYDIYAFNTQRDERFPAGRNGPEELYF